MTAWSFAAPIRVIGKQRPRVVKGRAFTPKATADCERKIKAEARNMPKLKGKIAVQIFLTYKSRVRPDLDNAAKTVLDALNGVAYDDDKQVRFLTVSLGDPDDGCVEDGLCVFAQERKDEK